MNIRLVLVAIALVFQILSFLKLSGHDYIGVPFIPGPDQGLPAGLEAVSPKAGGRDFVAVGAAPSGSSFLVAPNGGESGSGGSAGLRPASSMGGPDRKLGDSTGSPASPPAPPADPASLAGGSASGQSGSAGAPVGMRLTSAGDGSGGDSSDDGSSSDGSGSPASPGTGGGPNAPSGPVAGGSDDPASGPVPGPLESGAGGCEGSGGCESVGGEPADFARVDVEAAEDADFELPARQ